MKKLLTAFALLFAASAVNAQSYIGAGVMHLDAEEIALNSVTVTYDYKPTNNFSLQIGLAAGGDDTINDPFAGNVEFKLDYSLSAKGKLGTMVGNSFLYAMAGYANFNLEARARALGFTVSQDGNGSLFGAGVDFGISNTWGFGVEYARGFGDLEDTNLLQATLQYRF